MLETCAAHARTPAGVTTRKKNNNTRSRRARTSPQHRSCPLAAAAPTVAVAQPLPSTTRTRRHDGLASQAGGNPAAARRHPAVHVNCHETTGELRSRIWRLGCPASRRRAHRTGTPSLDRRRIAQKIDAAPSHMYVSIRVAVSPAATTAPAPGHEPYLAQTIRNTPLPASLPPQRRRKNTGSVRSHGRSFNVYAL